MTTSTTNNSSIPYKQLHTFDERKAESTKIRLKYVNRIPIIVEKAPKSKIAQIDKRKYLIPEDMTLGQFQYVVRKRMHVEQTQNIFIYCNNILPQTSSLMSSLYEEHRDQDGFLYLTYSGEHTFGC